MIILVWLSPHSWGSEKILAGYDPGRDIISDKYEAGPFLIYDCEEGHWVCVLASYYQDCLDKRKKDLVGNQLKNSCIPLEELPTKKSCFQKQLFLTAQNHSTRFCMNDKWSERDLPF